ncbi:MAG: amino acid ABC transporter substrate-binding protein [Desulfobacterales bacterium]|nr:amino acid ABC transporter substrate-binding protein [Desulfobacterales bacterium]
MMKFAISYFTIIISLFSTSLLFAETTTIRITNGEWEPFMSAYCPHYGINSHVVSESYKLEGINVRWGFFPWKRAYQTAKTGKGWDASATWWPAEETKEAFYLSEPVSKTSFVFFHLKSYKFNWDSIDDLKGIHIGGTFEYDYGKEFMSAIEEKKISVQYVPHDEMNYKKLLKDRIQIFPNDPIVGYAQIRNSIPPDQVKLFTHHPKQFEISTLHLIISKKCKNGKFFLDKFNSGFKKLKQSGRFDQMLKDLEAGKYDKQKVKWKE